MRGAKAPRTHGSRRALALALAALALLAAGCGSEKDVLVPPAQRAFTVALDSPTNATHAALYTASSEGDFGDVGLQVVMATPQTPAQPLQLLEQGRADVAISHEPEVLIARDRGAKIVSIAALVQRPLASIIALPGSPVRSVATLAGRSVATSGLPFQTALLRAALAGAAVSPASVRVSDVGFQLNGAITSGAVDATFGGFWNYQATQLRAAGRRPTVIPIDQAGIPRYDELVLVVREEEARYRGEELRSFLQALSQGERSVRADPAKAATTLVRADPSLQPAVQLASIRQTVPVSEPAESGEPFGWQSPAEWAAFGGWMFSRHIVAGNPNAAPFPAFTNEFLPGQGI